MSFWDRRSVAAPVRAMPTWSPRYPPGHLGATVCDRRRGRPRRYRRSRHDNDRRDRSQPAADALSTRRWGAELGPVGGNSLRSRLAICVAAAAILATATSVSVNAGPPPAHNGGATDLGPTPAKQQLVASLNLRLRNRRALIRSVSWEPSGGVRARAKRTLTPRIRGEVWLAVLKAVRDPPAACRPWPSGDRKLSATNSLSDSGDRSRYGSGLLDQNSRSPQRRWRAVPRARSRAASPPMAQIRGGFGNRA